MVNILLLVYIRTYIFSYDSAKTNIHKFLAHMVDVCRLSHIYTYIFIYVLLFSEWGFLEDQFYSLCNTPPYNCQLNTDKLKVIAQLNQDGKAQISKLISSSTDVRETNNKIITYLIVKLCYNGSDTDLAKLCDIMKEMNDSTNMTICVQHITCGKFSTHTYI